MSRNNTIIDGNLFITDVVNSRQNTNLVYDTVSNQVFYEDLNTSRPSSATNVIYDVNIPSDPSWYISSVSLGNPSTGQISFNTANIASITTVKVHKTCNASSTGAQSFATQMEDLAISSSIYLEEVSSGDYGSFRISSVIDQGTYMQYGVTFIGGGGGGIMTVGQSSTLYTLDAFYIQYVDTGYNYFNITNNGISDDTIIFKASQSCHTSDHAIVETIINTSSPANVPLAYQLRSGSVTGQVNKPVYTIGSSGSLTNAIIVDTNDVVIMDFLCWGTSSNANWGLAPSVAVQAYNG